MTSEPPTIDIRHNADAERFEAFVDGTLCRADYRMHDGVMRLIHTEVPQVFAGRGIAGQLVAAALVHARAHGLKVVPACSYVRTYMRRRPETHDLLPVGASI